MSLPRPDINAKQMFFVGFLGLPWLWIVNVMYYWKAVYGTGTDAGNDDDAAAAENQGILGMMASDEDEDANATENEPAIPPELIKLELAKWVKRSTAGSFISLTAFITWIIVFQLNKDSFGPKWFVMSQEEEALTGW